jgi:hypothetical protein
MQELEENGYSLANMTEPSEETLNLIMSEATADAFELEKRTNGEFLMRVRKMVFKNYSK